MSIQRSILIAATAAALPLMSACGDDPAGVGQGSVTASMHDDASTAAPSPAQQSVQESGSSGQSAYSGSASGSAEVFIFSEAQGWVSLGAPPEVDVELQSGTETTLYADATVPADTYTRVRLVLDGFAAHLDAGAVIGTVSFAAVVDVSMGGSDTYVVIEKEVTPFTITANGSAALSFDLNTEVWMDEDTANAEQASDTEVQQATEAEATTF